MSDTQELAAKVEALDAIAASLALSCADAIAVGDGANDIALLQAAGLGVALHGKPPVRAAADVRLHQQVDRGEHERGGLAGAGLRDAEQVAPFEHQRDRVALDRGRGFVILGGERVEDRLRQAERLEGHDIS